MSIVMGGCGDAINNIITIISAAGHHHKYLVILALLLLLHSNNNYVVNGYGYYVDVIPNGRIVPCPSTYCTGVLDVLLV